MATVKDVSAEWCRVRLRKWENPDDHRFGYVKDRRSPERQDDFESSYIASPEGRLYVTDSRCDVRMKHVGIVFYSPFILLSKLIFRIGRFLSQVAVNLVHGKLWKMFKNGAKALRDLILTPFFWVAMIACSIYGWVDPYGGRNGVGSIENYENHGATFKSSCLVSLGGFSEDCSCLTSDDGVFYIAPCMQVRGNLNDPKWDVAYWVRV